MKDAAQIPSLGPLPDGGRVVIIGGGPGGVSCSLLLQRLAAERGITLEITIIENKEFAGERHYNQCVGVLSSSIAPLIENQLRLPFPYHLNRRLIQGYVLHAGNEQILLKEAGKPSFSLRRVQFDDYMLAAVKQLGIRVLPSRAVDLEFFDDHVVVYTESEPVKGDVVIGAWGTDDGSSAIFHRVTGYQAPEQLYSIVTKFHPSVEAMESFAPYIHAFLPRLPHIEFGGVTPKGDHITINIAGKQVDSNLMHTFLAMPVTRSVLPSLPPIEQRKRDDLQFYKGKFPCSLAKKYFGDRYVVIGDAAGLVRAFKGKGVTSAVLTGVRAAEVIMQQGISEACFATYYQAANQDIIQDFPYGRMMRYLTILMSKFQLFGPVLRAAKHNQDLEYALLDAVSAQDSYRNVLKKVLKLSSVSPVLREMLKANEALVN